MKFKDLQEGQVFRINGELLTNTGQEAILTENKHALVKVPFMRNFYRTTGNKRNAKMQISVSKMNQKYFYIDDEQMVELIDGE